MAEIKDVKLGTTQVNKIYCGSDLVFEKVIDTTAPITTPRPIAGTYTEPQTVWLDVNEASDTYYTTNGTTPTTASTKYVGSINVSTTTTLKYFSVDLAGNTEAVKTTTYTINAVDLPTTTISPTSTVQNTIPFTVTLTTDEVGATIYYRLGTGTQQTYSAPFTVNQNSAGVQSTNITVYYWAVGAEGTEAEKSITYNTSGAMAGKTVLTVTAGYRNVALSWGATANTTSYNVYRSTTSGTLGTLLSQYQTATTYNDPVTTAGTYYYTVRSSNYGNYMDSDQKSGVPTVTMRYIKIEGWGTSTDATTRVIEVEAWEGATNLMTNSTIIANQAISAGSTNVSTIKDGVKTTTSNTYPIWWATPLPNANIIVDFGSQKAVSKLNYYSYSISGDQRQNRFKIFGNSNGVDYYPIWDMSTNTTPQPILPSGYEKLL